jgi:hypothetical protein
MVGGGWGVKESGRHGGNGGEGAFDLLQGWMAGNGNLLSRALLGPLQLDFS